MIVFCTAVFQTKCTGHNDEAFNSSVLRSETSKYILQTFIATAFVYKTASITVITIFQPMGKSVHYQGFNIDKTSKYDLSLEIFQGLAHQRESFWLKLLPMTGTGWIRAILTISDHFAFLVGSEKCIENAILIFFGS